MPKGKYSKLCVGSNTHLQQDAGNMVTCSYCGRDLFVLRQGNDVKVPRHNRPPQN
jgi:hypothetical protein